MPGGPGCLVLVTSRNKLTSLVAADGAHDLYCAGGNRAWQAAALNNIGWYHIRLHRYQEAVDACEQALRMHEQLGDLLGQANTSDTLGYAHHHAGDYQQATACYNSALDLFRQLGNRHYEAVVLGHLGDTHRPVGRLDAARNDYQQALAILEELQHPDSEQVRGQLRELRATPGSFG